jgi:predicted unusual protein kinase regulating ubiquinone biosynthesis (AarF/ABC1/UbiB family)
MAKNEDIKQAKVPKGRLSRMFKLGGLASKIAGDVALSGARQFVQGNSPKLTDLILTPANIGRIGKQLANMRGAAMKIGQLMSMDAGDLLPAELTALLEHLRSNAQAMPLKQLQQVLEQEWGTNWHDKFIVFSFSPFAAASIGQVHLATSSAGQMLAIKIQYPGIGQSIDSDIDNVATLLNISGLLPKQLEIKPLLEQAKKQLHDEANYILEADYIEKYTQLIAPFSEFIVPSVNLDLSTKRILAMSHVQADPIESVINFPQEIRNQVATSLITLLLKEVFEFGLVQTDPNFANYMYQPESNKIVLLDFGATRHFPSSIAEQYLQLIKGCLASDNNQIISSAEHIGLIGEDVPQSHKMLIAKVCMEASEPLQRDQEFDFASSDLVLRMHNAGMELSSAREFWRAPPADVIFVHRKVGGLYLLASKLKAKVNVHALIKPFLK